ncbi:hypothetical protein C8T65DRAFT_742715 [Cerioporus squamosus]|nr:hypothetical protein C8T65DRAFT_742715 [Cerioporus squamosus]
MRVEVPEKHLYVFESLFKTHRGARRVLTWKEFTKAMTALGFGYESAGGGGSARKFTKTQAVDHPPVHQHQPHGKSGNGKLDEDRQDMVARALRHTYGWEDVVFVPKSQPAS